MGQVIVRGSWPHFLPSYSLIFGTSECELPLLLLLTPVRSLKQFSTMKKANPMNPRLLL